MSALASFHMITPLAEGGAQLAFRQADGSLLHIEMTHACAITVADAIDDCLTSSVFAFEAAKPGKPAPAAEVTPFHEAYRAPWRMSDCAQEIQDGDGCHVTAVDLDDPDEREFWRGILTAVNSHDALLAFVRAEARRDPVFAKGHGKVLIAEAKALVAAIDEARS